MNVRVGLIAFIGLALIFGVGVLLGFNPFAHRMSEKGMDDTLVNELRSNENAHKGSAPLFFKVAKVVDGDTFVVKVGSGLATIRVLGINTPETVDPRKPVQCFGHEASAQAHALLDGKSVSFTLDHTESPFDKYGRVLAYVALAGDASSSPSYNEKMIRDGYAFEYTYAKPYERQKEFRDAQTSARSSSAGLWATSTCSGQLKSLTNAT